MNYLIEIGRQSFELTRVNLQNAFYFSFAVFPIFLSVYILIVAIIFIYRHFRNNK